MLVGARVGSLNRKVGAGPGDPPVVGVSTTIGVTVAPGGGTDVGVWVGVWVKRAAVCVEATAAVSATIVSTAPGTGDGTAAGAISVETSQLITSNVTSHR